MWYLWKRFREFWCLCVSSFYTGLRRMNRTIQSFNRINENLYKITSGDRAFIPENWLRIGQTKTQWTIRSGSTALYNSSFTASPSLSRRWAPERSLANLLGADFSRHYRSRHRTVSQTYCRSLLQPVEDILSTALTNDFGATNTSSQLCVYCGRNTELGHQKKIVRYILRHPVYILITSDFWRSNL